MITKAYSLNQTLRLSAKTTYKSVSLYHLEILMK